MAVEEGFSRPAHTRYSFDGAGEAEIPLTAGLEVEVLDDQDAAKGMKFSFQISALIFFSRWWYIRNSQTGQEGVVPTSHLY